MGKDQNRSEKEKESHGKSAGRRRTAQAGAENDREPAREGRDDDHGGGRGGGGAGGVGRDGGFRQSRDAAQDARHHRRPRQPQDHQVRQRPRRRRPKRQILLQKRASPQKDHQAVRV